MGSTPAPLPWWRKPLPMRNLLVVPVVLQMATTAGLITLLSYQSDQRTANEMATATQVRTMRQVSDDPHADLRVPRAMQGGRNRWEGGR